MSRRGQSKYIGDVPFDPVTAGSVTASANLTTDKVVVGAANNHTVKNIADQVANRLFAGPSSGADAAPSFRAMVNADLCQLKPSNFENQSANRIAAGPTSGGAGAVTFRALVAADFPDPLAITRLDLGRESKSMGGSQVDNMLEPTGSFVVLTSSAAIDWTGIVAPDSGGNRVIHFVNGNAANAITLKHNNSGSTAGNRFSLPNGADWILNAGEGITLVYDGTSLIWRSPLKAASSLSGLTADKLCTASSATAIQSARAKLTDDGSTTTTLEDAQTNGGGQFVIRSAQVSNAGVQVRAYAGSGANDGGTVQTVAGAGGGSGGAGGDVKEDAGDGGGGGPGGTFKVNSSTGGQVELGRLTGNHETRVVGPLVQRSKNISAAGDRQCTTYYFAGQTTDATQTELTIDGQANKYLTLADGDVLLIQMRCFAKRSGSGNIAYMPYAQPLNSYSLEGIIYRLGSTTALDGDSSGGFGSDNGFAGSVGTITGMKNQIAADDTNDRVAVKVTGRASETWEWLVELRVMKMNRT